MNVIEQIVLTREWDVGVCLAIAAWTIGATGAALLNRAGVNIPAPSVNLTFGIAFTLFFILLFIPPGFFLTQGWNPGVLVIIAPAFLIAGLLVLIFNILKKKQTESFVGIVVRLAVTILILANCYWIATFDG